MPALKHHLEEGSQQLKYLHLITNAFAKFQVNRGRNVEVWVARFERTDRHTVKYFEINKGQ